MLERDVPLVYREITIPNMGVRCTYRVLDCIYKGLHCKNLNFIAGPARQENYTTIREMGFETLQSLVLL